MTIRVLAFRTLALACALWAPDAGAQGINVSWDDCWAAGGVAAKQFACDTNTGASRMVGSFMSATPQPGFVGVEIVIDLQVDTVEIPPWWQFFNAGACRLEALQATFDFDALGSGACAHPFGQAGLGGLAAYQTNRTDPPNPYPTAARARVKAAGAVAVPHAIAAGVEYYGFVLGLDHTRTVGAGACAGCATGVTLVLNEIKSAELNGRGVRHTAPLGHQCVTWHAGTVPCATLPARRATWGRIKSIWR